MNFMEPQCVILGASPQHERYSYLAYRTLHGKGIPFVLVNPRYTQIDRHPVLADLSQVKGAVGTVTMYLAPERQDAVAEALLNLRPGRVIFNPGAENPPLRARLVAAGIPCLEACTLVLLRTGQF